MVFKSPLLQTTTLSQNCAHYNLDIIPSTSKQLLESFGLRTTWNLFSSRAAATHISRIGAESTTKHHTCCWDSKTQMSKTKTLSSRTKTHKSKNQKHNSITDWLKIILIHATQWCTAMKMMIYIQWFNNPYCLRLYQDMHNYQQSPSQCQTSCVDCNLQMSVFIYWLEFYDQKNNQNTQIVKTKTRTSSQDQDSSLENHNCTKQPVKLSSL